MKKNNSQRAEELMLGCHRVWKKLKIYCGSSTMKGNEKIGYSVEEKKEEHDRLLIQKIEKLGYNKDKKVPKAIRQILESENFHSLNRVLEENNLCEGNFQNQQGIEFILIKR